MGLLDRGSIGRYHNTMLGKTGATAEKMAARYRLDALDEAQGIYEQQYPEIMGRFDPYAAGGAEAYEMYQQGITPEGYAANLEVLSSSPAYDALLAPRMEAVQRQLAASGLGRSSYGARRAADVSQETLTGLEGLLSGRQRDVAGIGLGATGTQAGLQQNLMDTLANIAQQRGEVLAGGELGAQMQRAQGAANQYRVIHNVGSSLMSMFGMGGFGGGGGDLDVSTENYGGGGSGSYNINNPNVNTMYGGYA